MEKFGAIRIDTIFLKKAFNKIKKETTYPCDNGGYLWVQCILNFFYI